jgi:uncharacterized phiE125 gp8 family phage protein
MNIVKRIASPTYRPISIDTAKEHLKVSGSAEDNLIGLYLDAAIRACENKLQRSIMDSAHELYAKTWQPRISLQQYPVSTINSVKYYDDDGALQTVATGMYRVQSFRRPSVLEFVEEFDCPSLQEREYPVVINFNAGHAIGATGSEEVRFISGFVLMELTDRYENRQNEVAGTSIAMFSNNADAALAQEALWI